MAGKKKISGGPNIPNLFNMIFGGMMKIVYLQVF
jgi:hypothetical protein